jgi:SEC-C motif domain protein
MSDMIMGCPCGSNKPVGECCELIISGKKDAETAEELMRSRYVAFTKADINYLMRSHHSTTRPIRDRQNIERWAKSVQWIGLQILNREAGNKDDLQGMVEFRALYMENSCLQQLHERSKFVREKEKWVYLSGEHF